MHLEKSCKACVPSGERGMVLTPNQKTTMTETPCILKNYMEISLKLENLF